MDSQEWAELLERQRNVATSAQCAAAGISTKVQGRRVRAGLWARPFFGVVVLGPGKPTYEQLIWSALLSIGGNVAASHETALWLAAQHRQPPAVVHVAVLDGRDVAPRTGVRVHHLPTLDGERVEWQLSPPRTQRDHTVVDLGRLCRRPGDVVRLLTDVVGGRITTADRLAAVAASRPRLRWRDTWEALLPDLAAGAESALEIKDLRNDRAHGMPVSWRQEPRRRNGRAEWLDVEYRLPPPGRTVHKELDGRLGHGPQDTHRDMSRDNVSVLRRGLPLRFGWLALTETPCAVAAMQSLILQGEGWDGAPTSCGAACAIAAEMRRMAAEAGHPPPRTP